MMFPLMLSRAPSLPSWAPPDQVRGAEVGLTSTRLPTCASGKTTLLDIMAFRRTEGVLSQGDILINGCSTTETSTIATYTQRLGYVEQLQGAYFEDLTVEENMMFAAMLRLPSAMPIVNKMQRAAELLAMLGLQDQAGVLVGDDGAGSGLSGGQKRKLAIAIELLHDPTVLAMDEPTSASRLNFLHCHGSV